MDDKFNIMQNESREELLQRIAELEQELSSLRSHYAETDMAVDLESARILKEKYEQMHSANKNFSIRALARKVKISSGKLSDIFNGRYILSRELAQRIVDNLNFGEALKQEFIKAVEDENTRIEAYRDFVRSNSSKERLYSRRNKQIGDHDEIELIDNWACYGLMAAMGLKDCDNSVAWLANKMNMDEVLTKQHLEKLIRVGLAEKKEGLYFPLEGQTINNSQAAGTKASKLAANKCSLSAFQFLSEKLAADIETEADLDPSNKTTCFVCAVDSEKIGNVPEFLSHTMWSSIHDMGKDDNRNQLYMMMMSFRKI